MPEGYTADELPSPVEARAGAMYYTSKTEMNGRVLRYTRRMEIKDVLIPADQLGELKNLYRQVASDEKAKAVLKKQ